MGEKDGVKKVCYSMIGIDRNRSGWFTIYYNIIYIYITMSKSMVPSCKLTYVYVYIPHENPPFVDNFPNGMCSHPQTRWNSWNPGKIGETRKVNVWYISTSM